MADALAIEACDDPFAYRAESEARAQRVAAARALVAGCVHAAGAVPPSEHLPTRRQHEEHLRAVETFVALFRRARSRTTSWRPGSMVLRWLHGAGVRLDEVLRELSADSDECEWCARGGHRGGLHLHGDDLACAVCIERHEELVALCCEREERV